MSKKVTVILRKPPHGSLFSPEGLRVAVAVSASDTTVVSLGDGVYTFLKNVDMALYQRHINFLKDSDTRILVDKHSLEERGLKKEDLIEDVEVVEHNEVLKALSEADATITF